MILSTNGAPNAGRQPGTAGANANGQMDVAPADGEEEEAEPVMDKEASGGAVVDTREEEQGLSQTADDKGPEDRYEAKGAEHDEDHRYVMLQDLSTQPTSSVLHCKCPLGCVLTRSITQLFMDIVQGGRGRRRR